MSNQQPTQDTINQLITQYIDGDVRSVFLIFQYEDVRSVILPSGERPDRAWIYDVTVDRGTASERIHVIIVEKNNILSVVRTEKQL